MIRDAAKRYTEAGLRIFPIRGDGSKAPAIPTWKEFPERIANEEELGQWVTGPEDRGIANVGGHDLEILDIELRDIFERFAAAVEEQAPGLVARLTRVETPGKYGPPGDHLYYFCETAGRSQTLACTQDDKRLIETKGEGG